MGSRRNQQTPQIASILWQTCACSLLFMTLSVAILDAQTTHHLAADVTGIDVCDPCGGNNIPDRPGLRYTLHGEFSTVFRDVTKMLDSITSPAFPNQDYDLSGCCGPAWNEMIKPSVLESADHTRVISHVMVLLHDVDQLQFRNVSSAPQRQKLNNALCALRTLDGPGSAASLARPCLLPSLMSSCCRSYTGVATASVSLLRSVKQLLFQVLEENAERLLTEA